jgi:hypothetical protein
MSRRRLWCRKTERSRGAEHRLGTHAQAGVRERQAWRQGPGEHKPSTMEIDLNGIDRERECKEDSIGMTTKL